MNKLKKITQILLISTIVISLVGCNGDNTRKEKYKTNLNYNFNESPDGWIGDFADLPVDADESFYELAFQYTDIPVDDNGQQGLMIKGNNHSDDLFMYIARKFDGLTPNTSYEVHLSFDMATNVPGGMMGIGGSPGSSVYVKAGVVNVQPKIVEEDGYYRINIDKANQSQSGKDMIVLGNIEKADSTDDSFQYKPFETSFTITTNDKGEAWVIIGIDSGFEGLSQLYYGNINVNFTEVTE